MKCIVIEGLVGSYLVPIFMSITEGLSKSLRRSAISIYTGRERKDVSIKTLMQLRVD